jgi:hypothetical protein
VGGSSHRRGNGDAGLFRADAAGAAAADPRALGRGCAWAQVAAAGFVDDRDLPRGAGRRHGRTGHSRSVASEPRDAMPGYTVHRAGRQPPGLTLGLGANRRTRCQRGVDRDRLAGAAVRRELAVVARGALGPRTGESSRTSAATGRSCRRATWPATHAPADSAGACGARRAGGAAAAGRRRCSRRAVATCSSAPDRAGGAAAARGAAIG